MIIAMISKDFSTLSKAVSISRNQKNHNSFLAINDVFFLEYMTSPIFDVNLKNVQKEIPRGDRFT